MSVPRPPEVTGLSNAMLEATAKLRIGQQGINCEGKFMVVEFYDPDVEKPTYWIMTTCLRDIAAGDYTGDEAVWPQSIFQGNGAYTDLTGLNATKTPGKIHLCGSMGIYPCVTKEQLQAILNAENPDLAHTPPSLADVLFATYVIIRGLWSSEVTYAEGEVVYYESKYYIALRQTVGDQSDISASDWAETVPETVDSGQYISASMPCNAADGTDIS